VFRRKKAPRPLFRKQKPARRIPLTWIIVGLIALLFWLVPVYSTPLDFFSARTPLQITVPPTATWTPRPPTEHGGRIVFTCTRSNYNQLCMINADGTDLQQLGSEQFANDYYPSFSPQGNDLLFASNRNGPFDIYLMMFGQRSLFRITDHVGDVVSPDFSPDGQQIVFANKAGDGPTAIWMVNRDGSDAHLFYAGPEVIVAVAWSPDGKSIGYAMQGAIKNEYEIYVMNVDGTNQHQITNGMGGITGSVSWSPDSGSILISAGPVNGRDIYRVDVKSGAMTQLTSGGNNLSPSFSPDGKLIAFNSPRNDNQSDLFIMNADGSSQRRLTDNPEPDWQPRWEPY
jgi:TolB protein